MLGLGLGLGLGLVLVLGLGMGMGLGMGLVCVGWYAESVLQRFGRNPAHCRRQGVLIARFVCSGRKWWQRQPQPTNKHSKITRRFRE